MAAYRFLSTRVFGERHMRLRAVLWALMLLLAARQARAIGQPYCNITSVKSQQLANGVRLTIEADGKISPDANKLYNDYISMDSRKEVGRWTVAAFKPSPEIAIHLWNARSQVGNFVRVGKYPISHVRISITPDTQEHFGLDIAVVLYKEARLSSLKASGIDDYHYEHYLRNLPTVMVAVASDQRRLIITASSDHLPLAPEHLQSDEIDEGDRELKVSMVDGFLDISARNARLGDLVEAVGKATGVHFLTDNAANKVVNAELPRTTLKELTSSLCECYGLSSRESPDCLTLSDISAEAEGVYPAISVEEVPVRWVKAEAALELLPSFLLEYVRVNQEKNSLIVSGSPAFAEKIKADLAEIDRPGKPICVQATLLECADSEDLTRSLVVGYLNAGSEVSADPSAGTLNRSNVDTTSSGFTAKLASLVASSRVKVKATSSLTVANGESGTLFVGLDKYMQFKTRTSLPKVSPVSAGVKLTVKPWTGGGSISVSVTSEVSDISEVDPKTGFPVTNTRIIQGAYRVAPGETILIGGVSQPRVYETRRRIPLLGDLPFIGRLFRWKIRQKAQSELIALLTPTLGESPVPMRAGAR